MSISPCDHLFDFTPYSPNSTWLVRSRLDMTRHVRHVKPTHFGCVELVEQHGSTRSPLRARHDELDWLDTSNVSVGVSCRVETWRDVTRQVEFGLMFLLSYRRSRTRRRRAGDWMRRLRALC